MPTITVCPHCSGQVAIPDGVDPEAEVRCPLCEEQYTLASPSGESIPSLIVVGEVLTVTDFETTDFETEPETSSSDDEMPLFASDEEPSINPEGETPEVEMGDEISFLPVDLADGEASEIVDGTEAAEGMDLDNIDFQTTDFQTTDFQTTDADNMGTDEPEDIDSTVAFSMPLGEGPQDPGLGDSSFAPSNSTSSDAEVPEKKKERLGIFVQIGGIVVFGVIGLFIGYVILLYMKPAAVQGITTKFPYVAELLGLPIDAPVDDGENVDADPYGDGVPEPGSGLPNKSQGKSKDAPANNDDPSRGERSVEDLTPKGPFEAVLPDGLASLGVSKLSDTRASLDKSVKAASSLSDAEEAKDKDAAKKAKKSLFLAMCRLGQDVTLLEYVSDVESQSEAAAELLREAIAPNRRRFLMSYSHQKVFSKKKRSGASTGAMMLGRVRKIEEKDGVYEIRVELTGLKRPGSSKRAKGIATVLSNTAPDVAEDDTVAVLGSLLTDASKTLTGYERPGMKVVLSRVIVKIED